MPRVVENVVYYPTDMLWDTRIKHITQSWTLEEVLKLAGLPADAVPVVYDYEFNRIEFLQVKFEQVEIYNEAGKLMKVVTEEVEQIMKVKRSKVVEVS